MVGNEVENHAKSAGVGLRDQLAKLGIAPELLAQAEMVSDGVAKIAIGSSGYRNQPERGYAKRLYRVEPRGHVGETALAEGKRLDAVDNGPIDPGGMLARGINQLSAPCSHPKHDGALISAPQRVGHPQRHEILAIDARVCHRNLLTDRRQARKWCRVGALPGPPFVVSDRTEARRCTFTGARIEQDFSLDKAQANAGDRYI